MTDEERKWVNNRLANRLYKLATDARSGRVESIALSYKLVDGSCGVSVSKPEDTDIHVQAIKTVGDD